MSRTSVLNSEDKCKNGFLWQSRRHDKISFWYLVSSSKSKGLQIGQNYPRRTSTISSSPSSENISRPKYYLSSIRHTASTAANFFCLAIPNKNFSWILVTKKVEITACGRYNIYTNFETQQTPLWHSKRAIATKARTNSLELNYQKTAKMRRAFSDSFDCNEGFNVART